MHSEIERFAKEVASNAKFRDQVKAVGTDQKKLVDFANKQGYKFSMSDVNQLTGGTGEQLTEAQLEKVAGGFTSVLLAGSSSGYVYATKGRLFVWF